jgi:hypothetical protein
VSFSTDQVEVSGTAVVSECLKAHDTHSLVRALDDHSTGDSSDSSLKCETQGPQAWTLGRGGSVLACLDPKGPKGHAPELECEAFRGGTRPTDAPCPGDTAPIFTHHPRWILWLLSAGPKPDVQPTP